MLEAYVEVPHLVRKLRSGPAGPYIEGFAQSLSDSGYNPWSARTFLYTASHLAGWAQGEGLSIDQLNEDRLEPFRKHLRSCRCPQPNGGKRPPVIVGCRLFLHHLRQSGILAPAKKPPPTEPPLVEGFLHWMQQYRGVSDSTLQLYSHFVGELLHSLGEEPRAFDAHGLRTFVFERARHRSRGTAKRMVTALRMFLRYLGAEGKCPTALEDALPSLANWRLSTLPRYLQACDVERVVAACDDKTPVGARDRAIILLLARLGLRAGDIAELRVSDLDWRDASLCVSGKGRREVRLPLSQEVGDAILTYLHHRPPLDADPLFVCTCAPLRRLKSGNSVTGIVARALRRAGVKAPFYGAHVLRHSAATEMLRQGVSLQDIQAVLRHRSLQTTELYAKVDIALLQTIAQPWPEVSSCS